MKTLSVCAISLAVAAALAAVSAVLKLGGVQQLGGLRAQVVGGVVLDGKENKRRKMSSKCGASRACPFDRACDAPIAYSSIHQLPRFKVALRLLTVLSKYRSNFRFLHFCRFQYRHQIVAGQRVVL